MNVKPLALSVLLLGAVTAVDAGSPPAGLHKSLPCVQCHPRGEGESVGCAECHDSANHVHPTNVAAPATVPPEFPLEQGRLGCATCHRLHSPTGPYALRALAGRDSSGLRDLCTACHGAGLASQDPHRATPGVNRCSFCHAPIDPKAVLYGARPKIRAAADRVCDYCHNMGAQSHPRNIDPVLDLPPGLPRGTKGAITCLTCHSPHGSSRFTHYVREEYGAHFERGKEDNPHQNDRHSCAGCHVKKSPTQLTAADHELRFQGDANMLCISCHVRARSHHPVGVPVTGAMADRLAKAGGLPLDDERRTVCTTCHTNNCESGEQRMSVRSYEPKKMNLTLCWGCHDKGEFATTDPHQGSADTAKQGCVFCHDRPPVKGLERAEDLYFVSQVKMICLRCHESLSDLDVSHMGKAPSPTIMTRLQAFAKAKATEFPLEKDGRFTCTTCHNPHFATAGKGKKHRTRLPTREMCALCHER